MDDGASFTLPQNTLKSMIRQTIFAVAAPNDPRRYTPAPSSKSNPTPPAGFGGWLRLAMRCEEIKSPETASFVVPGKTLQEILKLLADEDKPMALSVGRRHIVLEISGYNVISRLLDGEFLAYQKAIPQQVNTTIRSRPGR